MHFYIFLKRLHLVWFISSFPHEGQKCPRKVTDFWYYSPCGDIHCVLKHTQIHSSYSYRINRLSLICWLAHVFSKPCSPSFLTFTLLGRRQKKGFSKRTEGPEKRKKKKSRKDVILYSTLNTNNIQIQINKYQRTQIQVGSQW